MAVVYRARDAELGRDVALKLLATADESAQGNARLLREAQALAQLSHPNVIHIYDVGRFADGVFLAMELVEGQRLDAWIREKPRRPDEVVPLFRDAARGLHAAHARGIVHRDFKPSNLILGSDGRVRVLDFGLARAADPQGHDSDAEITTPHTLASSKSLLDSPLTQEGALVGTPPYMAPEQYDGRCDARSDQFSFCIAMWYALYGERPFGGLNFEELKTNMAAGRTRPVTRNVPGWLHRILLRGLSPRPEDRFPSMEALLDELARDPLRRRRLLLAAGVLLLSGVGAFGWWRGAAPCGGAKLQGVWDAARRREVEAAFAATQKPFAAGAFSSLASGLDQYAASLLAMYASTCEHRGEQSAELFDLRMECLGDRLEQLRAQVSEFAGADAALVERASTIAFSLPPLAACADAAQLRAPVRPPADRVRTDALRKELAKARAQWMSGRYSDSPSEKLVAEAQSIGYKPALAEALLLQGRVQEARGRYAQAERSFRDARVAAEAGRVDEVAALAATSLMWVVGGRQGRYAEAGELASEARAQIERAGDSEVLLAELESKLSGISLEQGRFDDALGHAARAVELREKSLPPGDPALAAAVIDRADVLLQLGRPDSALPDYRRALDMYLRSLGPDHPAVASLLINYGDALRAFEVRDEALAQFARAAAIVTRSLGPEHPLLATIAVDTGAVLMDQGDLDGAVAELKKARALWVKSLGADHPNVATCDFRLGEVAMKRGRPAEAAALYRSVISAWEKKLGPDHPSLSAPLDGLGDALVAQHQAAAAAPQYQRALGILEKAVGPDHPDTVRTRKLLSAALKLH
jgi:tetratricopeptide (TPR) repeat protein